MEEFFRSFAGYVALGLEVTAAVLIGFGAVEAVIRLIRAPDRDPLRPLQNKKMVWLRLGVWMLLGLEFELGADIIRSAIAPDWRQLGQLAAIALIRTFLNYFLEKEIEKYAESRAPGEAVVSSGEGSAA